MSSQARVQRGTVGLDISDEFGALELLYVVVGRGDGRSPREVKTQLKELSDSFRVSHAPAQRQAPVPSAFRAFARQVGVDPGSAPLPIDLILIERLRAGRFRPLGLVNDAMVLASLETQVPLWALDGSELVGGIGVRPAEPGERIAGEPVAEGRLVVADALAPRCALLAPVPEASAPTKKSQSTVVFCLRVPGVPRYLAQEAVLMCARLLESD